MRTLPFDVECYPNFWCCSFLDPETGSWATLRLTEDGPPLDTERLKRLMRRNRIVSFNGISYDVPMVYAAINGFSNAKLKELSDMIIVGGLKPWEFERQFDISIPRHDHIDIIDVAPGVASLKMYGARLHTKRLQDLPYKPDAILTPEQMDNVASYNLNDLQVTWELYKSLAEDLALREDLSEMAGGVDLRSKKGAQVASAVLKHQITKLQGRPPVKSPIQPGTVFRYDPPPYLSFETPDMRALLDEIRATEFEVSSSGKVVLPKTLEGRLVRLGGSAMKMGIGGLHSTEKAIGHVSNDNDVLVDRDFDSYYPNLMLALGLAPRHIGSVFLKAFGAIVRDRMAAKARANDTSLPDKVRKAAKRLADRLKLIVNSTFGLTGSKYSYLYDPKVMIQVTLTGQLMLLWLAEQAQVLGIPVVSANTDGIVVKVARTMKSRWDDVISRCEKMMGLTTEETIYDALYSRDVNSYVALKAGGGVKLKGAFGPTGPQKNPAAEICVKTAVDHIVKGTPIDDPIYDCTDVRQFVSAVTSQTGATWRDSYLGKVVRWYWSTDGDDIFKAKPHDKTGNYAKVPKTEGAAPCMTLPDELPWDIDYDRYIAETREILMDIGFNERPPVVKPIRITKANRAEVLSAWVTAA